eukprot:scaffold18186_cov37-Prasinocladus_malaysianus.AAC.1
MAWRPLKSCGRPGPAASPGLLPGARLAERGPRHVHIPADAHDLVAQLGDASLLGRSNKLLLAQPCRGDALLLKRGYQLLRQKTMSIQSMVGRLSRAFQDGHLKTLQNANPKDQSRPWTQGMLNEINP